MAQNYPLDEGDPVQEPFFDATQEFLSGAAPYFYLQIETATSIRAPAGAGDDQHSVGVDGLYRFRTSTVSAAHPGGAAGTYDVYATASANDYSGPPGSVDQTDYDFGLVIRAAGSPPTGVDASRKVGEVDWDGSAITGIRQLVGHRRDTAPIMPTAQVAGQAPLRARGASGQTGHLAVFEVPSGGGGWTEKAHVDKDGGAAFSSAVVVSTGATSTALGAQQSGDTGPRARLRGDGQLALGPGDGSFDWTLARSGAAAATLTGSLAISGSLTIGGQAAVAAGTAAGGDLSGTYPNPAIAAGAVTDTKVAAANKDGSAAVPSLRTLGFGAAQALAGTTRLDQVAAPTAAVSLNSQKVTNLAAPTVDTDAATRGWAKDRANHTGTQLASTISNFDAQVRTSRLDQMAAPTAAVALNAQKITGLADPTVAQDAATKAYADSVGGLSLVTAGAGLTKSTNTLDVGAGTGITVAADSVAVDTGVIPRKTVANTFTVGQQVIAPAADEVALDLRRGTDASPTADVLRVRNQANSATIARVDSGGKVYGTGLDASSQRITNVLDPTSAQDAATRAYVLAQIALGTGPTGAAGGQLAGTYPNPNLAASVAGAGLTGAGGAALDVGQGTGISVAADSVGIDTAVVPRLAVANVFTKRQDFQPDSDTAGLRVIRFTDSNPAGDLLQFRNAANSLTLARFDPAGKLFAPGLDAGSQKVTAVADPTADTDAANRGYARARANHTGTQTASTISDFDAQVRTSRLDQMAAPTAAVSLNSQRVTTLADATAAGDAVSRGYADARYHPLNGDLIGTTIKTSGSAGTSAAGIWIDGANGLRTYNGTPAGTGQIDASNGKWVIGALAGQTTTQRIEADRTSIRFYGNSATPSLTWTTLSVAPPGGGAAVARGQLATSTDTAASRLWIDDLGMHSQIKIGAAAPFRAFDFNPNDPLGMRLHTQSTTDALRVDPVNGTTFQLAAENDPTGDRGARWVRADGTLAGKSWTDIVSGFADSAQFKSYAYAKSGNIAQTILQSQVGTSDAPTTYARILTGTNFAGVSNVTASVQQGGGTVYSVTLVNSSDGRTHLNYLEMDEISNPAVPSANSARLFVRDSVGTPGKTELAVRFPGGIKVLATDT